MSTWTVVGTQIQKDGQSVFLAGACYAPTPAGAATFTPAAAGVLAVAALGLAGAAAAQPTEDPSPADTEGSSAADTISRLRAQGYDVQINGPVTDPLEDCTVTGVDGLSEGPIDPNQLNTVYVNVSCPSSPDDQ